MRGGASSKARSDGEGDVGASTAEDMVGVVFCILLLLMSHSLMSAKRALGFNGRCCLGGELCPSYESGVEFVNALTVAPVGSYDDWFVPRPKVPLANMLVLRSAVCCGRLISFVSTMFWNV